MQNTLKKLINNGLITKRPEQLKFSAMVFNSLKEGQIAIYESPTGTGKTLGYISAAVDFCAQHKDMRVIVSTYSKQLQNQIEQEISTKILSVHDPTNFRYALVKGKSNYLLRQSIIDELNKARKENYKEKIAVLERLLKEANHVGGDIELLSEDLVEKIKQFYPAGIDTFQTRLETPIKDTDYALQVREKAEKSNFIIVNHALLIAYSLLLKSKSHNSVNPIFGKEIYDAETLPEDRLINVIVDESHRLEHMAMLLLSRETALRDLVIVGKALISSKEPISNEYKTKFQKIQKQVDEIIELSKKEHREYILISRNLISTIPVLSRINKHIKSFKDFANETAELIEEFSSLRNSVKDRANRIRNILNIIYNILKSKDPSPSKNKCFLITFSDERAYPSFAIVPSNIGGALVTALNNFRSIVLTGATLQDPPKSKQESPTFEQIIKNTGLNTVIKKRPYQGTVDTAVFKGFNLKEMATVYIYPDAPLVPRAKDENTPDYPKILEREYIQPMSETIKEIINQSRKCLILVPAHYETEIYFRLLKNKKDSINRDILIHPAEDTSFVTVVEKFNTSENSVLITASGWEGLDVDIDTLIISRIPFIPPNSPFYVAMKEAYKNYLINNEKKKCTEDEAEETASSWIYSRMNFDTFIKFRQGLGRAIRNDNSRCNIHILDRRILENRHKNYLCYLNNTYTVVETHIYK